MKFHLIKSPGATYIETIELPWDEVYVPKNDSEGSFNNHVRFKQDAGHINLLADSMRNGCDETQHPPVIRKLKKPKIVSGKVYTYELIAGFHRVAAGRKTNFDKWPFAVYEFDDEKAILNFQMIENDHPPAKTATPDDLANTLSFMVSKGWIKNDEAEMQDVLNEMTHIHHSTKSAAIKKAVRLTGAYQDVLEYTFEDVKDYLDLWDNYDEDTAPYMHSGNVDLYRNSCGWTVKEGYESEFLLNAIKTFSETGKQSYFICHTKMPTEKLNLNDKRRKMVTEFASFENALDRVFDYKEKHGSYPWRVEAFLPQDNIKGEKYFISA